MQRFRPGDGPDVAHDQHAECQNHLQPLLLPTHSRQLGSLSEDRLAACFRDSAADRKMQPTIVVVTHPLRPLPQIIHRRGEIIQSPGLQLVLFSQRRRRHQYPFHSVLLQQHTSHATLPRTRRGVVDLQ